MRLIRIDTSFHRLFVCVRSVSLMRLVLSVAIGAMQVGVKPQRPSVTLPHFLVGNIAFTAVDTQITIMLASVISYSFIRFRDTIATLYMRPPQFLLTERLMVRRTNMLKTNIFQLFLGLPEGFIMATILCITYLVANL